MLLQQLLDGQQALRVHQLHEAKFEVERCSCVSFKISKVVA